MATKTYATHRQGLAVAWEKPGAVAGRTVQATIAFANGEYTTDDPSAQAYIESLPTFKDDTIYLKTAADAIAAATAKAAALRSIATKAVAAADAADAELASLTKAPAEAAA